MSKILWSRAIGSFFCGAGLMLAVSAQADVIVFEDDFDDNNFASIWNVTDPGVDVGPYGDLCNNGTAGYCVDTEGTGSGTNSTFTLLNPIASLLAGNYTFSFDWANNVGFGALGDNILDWVISSDQGVLAASSVNSGSTADWTYENSSTSFSLAGAVTNATITFAQVGAEGDWGGTVLDNVKLTQVPAPATLLLFGFGLVGLGARRARVKTNR